MREELQSSTGDGTAAASFGRLAAAIFKQQPGRPFMRLERIVKRGEILKRAVVAPIIGGGGGGTPGPVVIAEPSDTAVTYLRRYTFDNSGNRVQDTGTDAINATSSGIDFAAEPGKAVFSSGDFLTLNSAEGRLGTDLNTAGRRLRFKIQTTETVLQRIIAAVNSGTGTFISLNFNRYNTGSGTVDESGALSLSVQSNTDNSVIYSYRSLGFNDGNEHDIDIWIDYKSQVLQVVVDGVLATPSFVSRRSDVATVLDLASLTRTPTFGAIVNAGGTTGVLVGTVDELELVNCTPPTWTRTIGTQVIITNDGPGNVTSPSIGVIRSGANIGRIWTTYLTASTPEGSDSTLVAKYSDDNGTTWSSQQTIKAADVNFAIYYGTISEMSDGSLIAACGRKNPSAWAGDVQLFRNTSGTTWDLLATLSHPTLTRAKAAGNIFELADGQWCISCEAGNSALGDGNYNNDIYVAFCSPSDRASWGNWIKMTDGDTDKAYYQETGMCQDPQNAGHVYGFARDHHSHVRVYRASKADLIAHASNAWKKTKWFFPSWAAPIPYHNAGEVMFCARSNINDKALIFQHDGTGWRRSSPIDTAVNAAFGGQMRYGQITRTQGGATIAVIGFGLQYIALVNIA
jgi:hypothetical protein